MPLFSLGSLRLHERATLRYSYSGEFGRGALAAVCADFALVVAVTYFAVDNVVLIWILSSAVFLGLMLAALGTAQTGRYRKKEVVFGIEIASRVMVLAAAFSPNGTAFAILIGLGVAIGAVIVPLVTGIYGANFGVSVRGRAVGRLQAIRAVAMTLFAVLAGAIVARDMVLFRAVLGATALLSMACAWYVYRLPEGQAGRNGNRLTILRDVVNVLKTDRAYAYLQSVWFISGLCSLWLIPLRVLHPKSLEFNEFEIMVGTTGILVAMQVLTIGLWGRILYRMNIVFYRVIVALFLIVGIPTFFYGRTPLVVFAGAVIWGAGLAGATLSWQLIATFFTTRHRLPVYMSVHTFLCGIRGVVGPLIALVVAKAYSTQVVANISVVGIVLTTLMLLPLAPAMRRRKDQMRTA